MQEKFFGKKLFAYKNPFAVEKKQKKLGEIQNFCRHQKNASHTISIYGKCMVSFFYKK